MEWFDGGYSEGDIITTSDNLRCRLLTSLGTLGWIALDLDTNCELILTFEEV